MKPHQSSGRQKNPYGSAVRRMWHNLGSKCRRKNCSQRFFVVARSDVRGAGKAGFVCMIQLQLWGSFAHFLKVHHGFPFSPSARIHSTSELCSHPILNPTSVHGCLLFLCLLQIYTLLRTQEAFLSSGTPVLTLLSYPITDKSSKRTGGGAGPCRR